ncbi:hypothetical protein [Flavobacterium sp.]|uniref:hypothetical protein n=1 Tax=Flavobacterium sp. TaxID=239 RepID=UPI003918C859
MSFGEIVFYLAITGIIIVIINKSFFGKSDRDYKVYQENLKSRLNDDMIYDPETGVKMTLEQAEKGAWIENDNLSRIKSKEEIEKYFDGSERVIEDIANILKTEEFKSIKLSNKQVEVLELTQILSKYDDWSYSSAFKINENDIIIFPEVHIHSRGKGTISFTGNQIMFWLKIHNTFGHYFLREKETHEKIFDFFRNDDDFKLSNFEVFSIVQSKNILSVLTILERFSHLKNIEIELQNDNLFIKTTNEPSILEFNSLFDLIKRDC